MIEVRRDSDGELCGHVHRRDDEWHSLTVFGGMLGIHGSRAAAEAHVRDEGLASLAEHWQYRPDPASEWQIVCIQEAHVESVRLALDYYSMPGVPTVVVTRQQLEAGAALVRDR